MAFEFDGTNDYIVADGGASGLGQESIYPLSLACWFYPTTSGVLQNLISVTSIVNARSLHLALNTTDNVLARTRSAADNPAITTTAFTTNTWHHAAGVWNGTTATTNTSRSAYLNGGGKGNNTTSVGTMGLQTSELNIGSRLQTTARGQYFAGYIAEVTFWQAALTDDDILQLATGINPTKVKPQSIVFYAPLIRELIMPINRKEQEFTSSVNYASLTASGAIAANLHPRRIG